MNDHSPAFERWKEQARAVPIMDEIVRRGWDGKLKREGKEFIGPCPRCGGDDRFSINTAKQVFNCRQCGGRGDVIDLVRWLDGVGFTEACTTLAGPSPAINGKDATRGAPRKMLESKHEYCDESGAVQFAVGRYEYQYPDGSFVLNKDGKRKKTFRQKRPDPDHPGKWINNTDGVRVVPYKLPELIEAIASGHSIAIVEGEAKVDLLWTWNVPATCNAGGAGKWKSEHSTCLHGADVVIIPDNDDPGRNHADLVAASLQGIAASVRVLELPGLPPKGDIIDWAKAGGTVEQLYDLSKREAKPWAPPNTDHEQ
jgi:DNA primase